ncbi:MAG: YHS domain-containing protein [Pedobacter sp.]|uniref:YHS domain-containing protein n=1 Tax=Pedobacter sp. TaxID=1411316 RepID=UPI002809A5F7|nr:YHS domain-containing protein [Pedobacter sp.]MDQ8005416.1 YHS domain-containing protein [Pedobacter sp.]
MKTTLIICIFALSFGALYTSKDTEANSLVMLTDSVKIDPVCKMKVKTSSNLKSTYQKQEYLFCGKGCKLKFDKNPEQYLKK